MKRFLRGEDTGLGESLAASMGELSRSADFGRAARARDDLHLYRGHLRRQSFYSRFVSSELRITEERAGLLHRFRFLRGTPVAGMSLDLGEEPEPAWVLADRASVIHQWLQTRRTKKTFHFVEAADSPPGR